jgi:hypothetical protein
VIETPAMFASLFDDEALTFTRIAAFGPDTYKPGANDSECAKAAANRFFHSTVPAGDSIVTSAAASPEHAIWQTEWMDDATAPFVVVTPELVPTAVAFQRALIFDRYGSHTLVLLLLSRETVDEPQMRG